MLMVTLLFKNYCISSALKTSSYWLTKLRLEFHTSKRKISKRNGAISLLSIRVSSKAHVQLINFKISKFSRLKFIKDATIISIILRITISVKLDQMTLT